MIFIAPRRQRLAAVGTGVAADFKHVLEVRGKVDTQRRGHLGITIVVQLQALVETLLPKKARALDVNDALGNGVASQGRQGTVGNVGSEEDVVLADGGAQ